MLKANLPTFYIKLINNILISFIIHTIRLH